MASTYKNKTITTYPQQNQRVNMQLSDKFVACK